MIELKNISKTYKSKKSKNTTALNGVSLTFDNNGMTFILGKSGSGKSTLLNVIGGLDKYDSGDMSILGKSSKDFTQADFDSYRNTYIGFIFQEFNILDDFDVYENIVLALQLQQKEVDKQKVDALLEKLELSELVNRKVNELSGGQKQRVAIARALIKDPKIILADEPTGNLDSATGQQVMELLKEISKDKLVIIVSHDREYANTYGDRVIEIKDGIVANDTNDKDISSKESRYDTIKSKLPFKDSFKLGIGSLKHKKIKLCFTILLTACTLLFLSVVDTLSAYNINRAHAKLLADRGEQFVQVEKFKFYGWDKFDFSNKDQVSLSKAESEAVLDKIGNNGYETYRLQEGYSYMSYGELMNLVENGKYGYYTPSATHIDTDIVVTDDINKIVVEDIIGRQPSAANEIVISSYYADLLIINGVTVYETTKKDEFSTSNIFKPQSYEDILNADYTFYFGSEGKVKIVGIIDYDLTKYKVLWDKDFEGSSTREENILYSELHDKSRNIYNKIYVNKDFLANLAVKDTELLNPMNNYQLSSTDLSLSENGFYASPSVLNNEITYYNGSEWVKASKLNKNEMIISAYQLKSFNYEQYSKSLSEYLSKHSGEDKTELQQKFFANYIKDLDVIGKEVDLNIYEGRSYSSDESTKKYENIRIVGIMGVYVDYFEQYNYFSMDLVKDYKLETIQLTGYLIPTTTEKDFKSLIDMFPYYDEISTQSTYSMDVTGMVRTIKVLKDIAFYISAVLLTFTIFLIANFIITSVNYRKKEIGVLRALGSRSIDIVKIFLWEGLVLSTIAGTISAIMLIVVTQVLNGVIMHGVGIILTPFIIGIRQFIVIYLIVIAVTVISSILPIRRISKMKPIDAILNK